MPYESKFRSASIVVGHGQKYLTYSPNKVINLRRITSGFSHTFQALQCQSYRVRPMPSCSLIPSWEKAETAALRQALLSLQKKRDIRQMAHCATPAAREFIDSLTLTRTFIDDTPRHSQSFRATAPAPKASVNDKTNPAILPRPSFPSQSSHDFLCDDTDKLLRLSYFFASSYHVPVDMLRSGTAPRCRWSKEGDVVCRQSSVHPHLVSFINDQTRLEDAIDKLTEKRYIECTTTDGLKMYRLLPNGSSKALDGLDQESASYWKRQALLVSYHAIPWKYLEPSTPISVMATPHLQHVLGNDESLHCFDLSAEVREDLILTLVEAVRLPKIPWKVFAVERAVALCGIGQSAYAIARVNEVTSLFQAPQIHMTSEFTQQLAW
ncbi:hypothetical protein CaCOL14_013430 [Colletotrichum acutatum]